MSKYIMRLDDACEKRDIEKWDRMEELLDKYHVKPLVGIIPDCEDEAMSNYEEDPKFWDRVETWIAKGWTMAMHGYNHVYATQCGGINPVNNRSEFAGEPFNVQKEKIVQGVRILRSHHLDPKIFFAPSHTFDENTLKALKEESNIRIISDTPANKPYSRYGMTFVPQQSGSARELPFHTVTFCYHPNVMFDKEFESLELFLKKHQSDFISFPEKSVTRKRSLIDIIVNKLYFARRGV